MILDDSPTPLTVWTVLLRKRLYSSSNHPALVRAILKKIKKTSYVPGNDDDVIMISLQKPANFGADETGAAADDNFSVNNCKHGPSCSITPMQDVCLGAHDVIEHSLGTKLPRIFALCLFSRLLFSILSFSRLSFPDSKVSRIYNSIRYILRTH